MTLDVEWLRYPWVISCLTIIAAVAAEHVVRWPQHLHPLGWYGILAQRIGRTLSARQEMHRPAATPSMTPWLGIILCALCVLPTLATLALLLELAALRNVLEACWLYLCIATFRPDETLLRVYRYLQQDKKQLARDTLQTRVLRDTAPLSALGIAKASCEMRILRNLHELAAPLLLYALGGIYLALGYRLTYTFMHAWNPKLPHYAVFGQGLHYLTRLCQWPAAALWTLILAINVPHKLFPALQQIQRHSPSAWCLTAVGVRLECQFSGPAQYAGNVTRFARVGADTPLKLGHLPLLSGLVLTVNVLFIILCMGVASL